MIKAHKGPINYIQLNKDLTILATASDKGTLILLFVTSIGEAIQELRRVIEILKYIRLCLIILIDF